MSADIYTHLRSISIPGVFSFDVYAVKPGGVDPKHHHNFEIVYVVAGNSTTHKRHHLYAYPKGTIHEIRNDSKDTLVLACLFIPSEGKTVYV